MDNKFQLPTFDELQVSQAGESVAKVRQQLEQICTWLPAVLQRMIPGGIEHPMFWVNPRKPMAGVPHLFWSYTFSISGPAGMSHGELRAYVPLDAVVPREELTAPDYKLVLPPEFKV